ncbi:class I SAM-dependent methyltransferase [Pseudomonas vanderleydeniana]|uniref:Class I SAM-dependent methyltransferase n=1 Tax=Pseudomonas vanderleydeniana TaxID=2745495 RepID=A0A9E6PHN2_9PSED|nr:class I SAM-dependent methyltransferase [Pseudomonas vanderleydeniana]QXI26281.1 class I SAM-dependent methyltransferase [Pseudomonas vanderleydeniana]
MKRLWLLREWVRFIVQVLRGGERRSSALLMRRRPPGLFQPYGTTQEDRYPEVFHSIRQVVADVEQTHILSFGCSTGEEVFTLARYFRYAHIRGLDIDAGRIGRCWARWQCEGREPRLSFACAGNVALEKTASYDLVLAMAVFRHGALGGSPVDCSSWIRFADFDRLLSDLVRVLKPGGLLVIRHANFRFGDTGVAGQFECLRGEPGQGSPVYGTDNRLLPGVSGDDGIYRKRSAPPTSSHMAR